MIFDCRLGQVRGAGVHDVPFTDGTRERVGADGASPSNGGAASPLSCCSAASQEGGMIS